MTKSANITPPYEVMNMLADMIEEFAWNSDECYAKGDLYTAKQWSDLVEQTKLELIRFISSLENPKKKQRETYYEKQGEKDGIIIKNKPK